MACNSPRSSSVIILSAITFLSLVLAINAAALACTKWQVSTSNQQSDLAVPAGATIRAYYISADIMPWTYTPLGIDYCNNFKLPGSDPSPKFQKALFREFKDAGFKVGLTSVTQSTRLLGGHCHKPHARLVWLAPELFGRLLCCTMAAGAEGAPSRGGAPRRAG
jgi:hypothetical protein